MKAIIPWAAGALFGTLLLAAACGGDGNGEEAAIRTQRGLAVAAVAAGAQVGEETADGGGDTASAPDARVAPPIGKGISEVGVIAPDFAPFAYPSPQESQSGITVQGFGSASRDADSALLEFYFGAGIDEIRPLPGEETESGSEGSSSSPPEVQPLEQSLQITEADLQPVVDAIVAQGVSRDDVEVTVEPSYGDPYYGGSATIRVTVRNVGSVDAIVSAATDAASGLQQIALQWSNVAYTVSDCAALELAAMEEAVQDARERGQSFAGALGVGLGPVEGASHYSYSPFGGSPCESGFDGPYPLGGVAYAEGQSSEVQLIATVTITFAIQ